MGLGARGREKRKRFNMYTSFSNPYHATIWMMHKEADTAAHTLSEVLEGRGKEGLTLPPVFFFQPASSFSSWNSYVLGTQGTKNCLWSLTLSDCKSRENSSGETCQAKTEMNMVLASAQQPAGNVSTESLQTLKHRRGKGKDTGSRAERSQVCWNWKEGVGK